MHVTLLCLGSHGDIRPYVALGVELIRKGHRVRLATDPREEKFCRDWGLEFSPLEGDLTSLITPESVTPYNKLQFARELVRSLQELVARQCETLLQALEKTDLMVYHPAVIAAPHAAEKLQLPTFRLCLQPEVRTQFHSSCLFPHKMPFGRYGNFISHLLAEQIFWQPFRQRINAWRKSLGISKVNLLGPTFHRHYLETPTLVAVSPLLAPRPPDWKQNIHLTGFLRLDAGERWQAPAELIAFLENGPPPLYLGFGSMSAACPQKTLESLLEILEEQGQRTIISGEFPGIRGLPLSDRILRLPSAPHDWLFPRVSAIIHHGGAGTTGASLHAGKPTLVCPFALDQFHWAAKLCALGIGPEPIPIKKFSPSLFTSSLQALVQNRLYREKAASFAKQISRENGAEEAAQVIMQHVSSIDASCRT